MTTEKLPSFIVVGNLGAGKTSLSKRLTELNNPDRDLAQTGYGSS